MIKLLSPIQSASEKSSLAKSLVDSGDIYHPLAWTPENAYRFLKDVPLFEQCGIIVRLPDWWKKRPRPRVSVTIDSPAKGQFSADEMLDFKLELALGDEVLAQDELQAILSSSEGLVFLRGQWVEIDRDKLKEALSHWEKVAAEAESGLSFIEGMRLLAGASPDFDSDSLPGETLNEWSVVTAGKHLGKILEQLRNPDELSALSCGNTLKVTLRKYQETGVRWLSLLSGLGLGACLADDMGLGKTVQVIALLSLLKEKSTAKPSILVLPASLIANWRSELSRFCPKLRFKCIHPSEMSDEELGEIAKKPNRSLGNTDIVLTSYGMLLRHKWLCSFDWQLAILDEAQAIKNPGAKQTKAVKQLHSAARIVLTGTPVENRLSDLWSIFDFLCPGLLGSQKRFAEFVKALSKSEHKGHKEENRQQGKESKTKAHPP